MVDVSVLWMNFDVGKAKPQSTLTGIKSTWGIFWAQTNSSYFQAKIIKLVDISYGGENGFNQVLNIISQHHTVAMNLAYLSSILS